MKLGIFAKTFPGDDPLLVLSQVRDAGYSCVQFNLACAGLDPMPLEIDETTLERIRDASHRTGIEIVAVSGTFNMAHPDLFVRRHGLRRLCTVIAAAPRMGTRLVTLCTGTRHPHDQWCYHPSNSDPSAWRDLTTSMEVALACAEAHDVSLGIEPEVANIVSSPIRARRLIDELASPRVAVVLDPANLFEQASRQNIKATIAAAVDLLGDRIVMAHAKDRAKDGSVAAAGKGTIDFVEFIRLLRQSGFDGPVVAHGLAAAEAAEVASFLSMALAGCATEAG